MNLDLLLNEIENDIENCDFRFIGEYETVLYTLKKMFGNNESVAEIEEVLNELKENSEDCMMFEAIREETVRNTEDEFLAEDVAWDLTYS